MRRRRLLSETQNSPPHAEEIASFPAHFRESPSSYHHHHTDDERDSPRSEAEVGAKSNQAIRDEYLKMLSELEHRVLALRIEQDRWAEWRAQEEEKLADAVEQIEDKEAECESLREALDDREKTLADALVNMKREAVRMDRRTSEFEEEKKRFVVKMEKQRSQIKKLRRELKRAKPKKEEEEEDSNFDSSSSASEKGAQVDLAGGGGGPTSSSFVSPSEKRPLMEAPPSLQLRVESPDKTVYNVFYSSRATTDHLRSFSSPQKDESAVEAPQAVESAWQAVPRQAVPRQAVPRQAVPRRPVDHKKPARPIMDLPQVVNRRRQLPWQQPKKQVSAEKLPSSSSTSSLVRVHRAPSAPQVSATDIIRGVRRSLTSLKSNEDVRHVERRRQTASSPEDISSKLTRFVDKAVMRERE